MIYLRTDGRTKRRTRLVGRKTVKQGGMEKRTKDEIEMGDEVGDGNLNLWNVRGTT